MTEIEYKEKMLALEPMDDALRKKVTCALLGHSHIRIVCFGYHDCARCGETVGDSLGGAFYDPFEVVVGHNCQICHANYEKLGWEDKILTPDPFTTKEEDIC